MASLKAWAAKKTGMGSSPMPNKTRSMTALPKSGTAILQERSGATKKAEVAQDAAETAGTSPKLWRAAAQAWTSAANAVGENKQLAAECMRRSKEAAKLASEYESHARAGG